MQTKSRTKPKCHTKTPLRILRTSPLKSHMNPLCYSTNPSRVSSFLPRPSKLQYTLAPVRVDDSTYTIAPALSSQDCPCVGDPRKCVSRDARTRGGALIRLSGGSSGLACFRLVRCDVPLVEWWRWCARSMLLASCCEGVSGRCERALCGLFWLGGGRGGRTILVLLVGGGCRRDLH
jgi:hypothetical protein